MESKIYIAQAEEMRKQGMTYREIGECFGVTYEGIRLVLAHMEPQERYFRAVTEKRCIYPGIREWMNQEKISPRRLAAMMGYSTYTGVVRSLGDRLSGRAEIRIGDIRNILRISGMTFEEAFGDGR